MLADQTVDLDRLRASGRLRRLIPQAGRDFSSNDYLALARSSLLADAATDAIARGVPAGSGGSRLLRGNHPEHEALEVEAAAFFGSEAALFFSTGYAANSTLLSTLPQRGDLILYDELVHASVHEGMCLSRASARPVPHNDINAVEDALREWRGGGGTGTAWIVAESLYSMDGDRAPLADLAAVARRHDAMLLVDEAHATGVFGPDGRGLVGDIDRGANVITLHTLGKGLGCEGALLCGPQVMRDFLVNRGRAFIFSTAPSPLIAAIARASLAAMPMAAALREELWRLVTHAQTLLAPMGARPTGSQILPLILGDDRRTMAAAAALQNAGFDVRGIRPPTVPEGTSRLRISITRNVSKDDIAALADVLGNLVQ